jgi:hypothetical protein
VAFSNLELIVMIDALANALHSSTLVGNPCPKVAAMWKRMQEHRPGDLVSERSTSCMRLRDISENRLRINKHTAHIGSETGIGIFVKKQREPMVGEWNEKEDGTRPTEDVWYIQRLDDETKDSEHGENVFRWTNCDFVTVLPVEGWEWFSKILPQPGREN